MNKRSKTCESKRLFNYDLFEAIENEKGRKVEEILMLYPESIFYPKLNKLPLVSFKMLKLLKKYYGPLFDIDCNTPEYVFRNFSTSSHESIREYTNFLLDNGLDPDHYYAWTKECFNIDKGTFFTDLLRNSNYENVHNIIMAHEMLKRGANVNETVGENLVNISRVIWQMNPNSKDLQIYLDFVDLCMQKQLLVSNLDSFVNPDIIAIINKY
jgi:hypothetical protein